MGCTTTRIHPEESTIENQRIKTGFEEHTAKSAVLAIRAHSTARLILSRHFYAIKKELNLNNKQDDHKLLEAFYAKLSTNQESDRNRVLSAYPRISQEDLNKKAMTREDDLTILAILLSRSSAKDKANALYDVFDDGLAGSLTKLAINEIFKVAFRLAIVDLPMLNKSKPDDIRLYFEKASQNYDLALAAAVNVVVPDQSTQTVAKKDFVQAVTHCKEADLTAVAGLRGFAVNLAQSALNPAKGPADYKTANKLVDPPKDSTAAAIEGAKQQ